jgi:hypothetical protein
LALDIVYTLMLDEVPLESRHSYRSELERMLLEPVGGDEVEGLTAEQIREQEAGEAMMTQWVAG